MTPLLNRQRNDFLYAALPDHSRKSYGMGITPAQLAARYWGYAAQCLIVAQRQDDASDKIALINMAEAWVALAEQAQREALERERKEGAC